ncbi:hypothetical protein RFH95_03650 [Acinetobacter nosocomialis]|uniref:hypothetical protein n=2 Tax=Acinetobacter nosocomialis TaxID=106654 RepID=UPI00102F0E6E|nr:hypothetical protein [Acinetobacter nosocomialis]MBD0443960.1 hypothetical protein [Acinetobacter nosocomialis]MDQ9039529.1 hypothetical protein [Acinetobacter nosocomialis]MDR9532527.1 hypothetical protein [Acinetobacter nosocomialis]QBF78794.1 hypothetical protein KAN02_12385 [Acinetobacter nosocomialis]
MMSKLSFFDASFSLNFEDIVQKIEKEALKNVNEYIKITKKRSNFFEGTYTHIKTILEEYIDVHGRTSTIERLYKKEIIFRIYNRLNNNFIIINQPRSILDLKNFLTKLFKFDFFINKKDVNLNTFLKNERSQIQNINKIDIREIIYPDNIFSKTVFYTQNHSTDLIEALDLYIKSNHYKIFKVEFYCVKFPSTKITLSYDFKISFLNSDVENIIDFFHNCFN